MPAAEDLHGDQTDILFACLGPDDVFERIRVTIDAVDGIARRDTVPSVMA
jgi:hypothetical protein